MAFKVCMGGMWIAHSDWDFPSSPPGMFLGVTYGICKLREAEELLAWTEDHSIVVLSWLCDFIERWRMP
jgi:hypothetical protein